MQSSYTKPPFDGSLSLGDIVDFNLDHNAECIYAYLPSDNDEPLSITWLELVHAIHRGAHIINPLDDDAKRIGNGKVVAIFAITDTLVYMSMILAIIRSGNIPFPISHRNTLAAVIDVMSKTSCRHLIIADTPSLADSTREVLRELDIQTFDVTTINMPDYHHLFPKLGREKANDKDFISYPRVGHSSQHDLVMILHSSGSTGFPKPIPYTQKFILDMFKTPVVQLVPVNSIFGTGHMPPFHLSGVYSDLVQPIGSGCSVALFQPVYPETISITPEVAIELFSRTNVDCLMTVPSFLAAWAKDERAISLLQKLKFIYWGGGPLNTDVGDYLASRNVPLCIFYAGTEFSFPTVPKAINRGSGLDAEDWNYVEFMQEAKVRWVKQDDDDATFEFQCLDSKHLTPAIHNAESPEGPAYTTSDLFMPHPTKANLWRIVGRVDDQVILSLGEKINPGLIEDVILKNSLVSGAVLFGRAKEQAGILVESISTRAFDISDTSALSKFRNEIWPQVEAANAASPSFARIFKEMILVTSPGKPLFRTPKGTIMRKASLRSYESEIEQIYKVVEDSKGSDIIPPSVWDRDGIEEWLTTNLLELLDRKKVASDADLFEQGADSLTATYIRNRLIGAMRHSADTVIQNAAKQVDHNAVFTYSTIKSLSGYVIGLINKSNDNGEDSRHSKEAAVRAMQDMIRKYIEDLPFTSKDSEESYSNFLGAKEVVLLTGSTGALGSQLLAQMLNDSRVEKIFAVNRYSSKPMKERQRQSFEDKGLDESLLDDSKLVYVEADTSKDRLGLDEELYKEISSVVTIVIHNAWRLDFNLTLASFESQIRGTRNLVDLAISSNNRDHIRIIFTSSIATLASWNQSERVPEEPISDAHYSVGNGYGESKYVAEKILEKAKAMTGIQTSIFRVGQLSGGRSNNGAWATTDWVPIILASSLHIGRLPDARGVISWLPLDSAASAILDVSFERQKMMEQTYHLWHPRPSKWTDIFRHASNAFQTVLGSKKLKLVPFYEWHQMLQQISTSASVEDLVRIPGLKLVDFFRNWAEGDKAMHAGGYDREYHEVFGQAEISTDKIVAMSPTMKEVEPLNQEDVHRWITYWSKKGLFDLHINN